MTTTALDIVIDAYRELRIVGAADVPSGEDAAFGLYRLNRLLDAWNAERAAVTADAMATYVLVPSTTPHTIGASGATWTASQRPVDILAATLVYTSGTRSPIEVHRDPAWYAGLDDPTTTGDPTDVWYAPEWPLGKLYFYPVPSTAYSVEVTSRIVLAALTLASAFDMAPGYQLAVTRSLAEDLAPSFNVDPNVIARQAAKARAVVFGNNDITPRISTSDAGMPGGTWRGSIYSGTRRP